MLSPLFTLFREKCFFTLETFQYYINFEGVIMGDLGTVGDSFGMGSAISGAGGQGFFENKESMTKGGLKAGLSITTGAAKLLSGGAPAVGPIGDVLAFTLDTGITFYEASTDLGKARSKIALLEQLERKPRGANEQESTRDILAWLINKLGRRKKYSHAESGWTHHMAKSVKASWGDTKKKKAESIMKGAGTVVLAPASTITGQMGTKFTRAGRGLLKKIGWMGSKRKDYAKTLYENHQLGDQLAKEMMVIILTHGIANTSAMTEMQNKIDNVVTGALYKGMSSFKE